MTIIVKWLYSNPTTDKWWYEAKAEVQPMEGESRRDTLHRATAKLPADGQGMLVFPDASYAIPPFVHPDARAAIATYLDGEA